jgi:hypothetical protein
MSVSIASLKPPVFGRLTIFTPSVGSLSKNSCSTAQVKTARMVFKKLFGWLGVFACASASSAWTSTKRSERRAKPQSGYVRHTPRAGQEP